MPGLVPRRRDGVVGVAAHAARQDAGPTASSVALPGGKLGDMRRVPPALSRPEIGHAQGQALGLGAVVPALPGRIAAWMVSITRRRKIQLRAAMAAGGRGQGRDARP